MFINQGASTEVVQFVSHNFSRVGETGTIYSGVKLDNDGNLYARQAAGGYTSIGSWLLNGVNSGFFVTRVIDSGTLTTDAGAGPLVLSTDREYDVRRSGAGTKTATVSFEISDDVSGAPIRAMITYVFTATKDVDFE